METIEDQFLFVEKYRPQTIDECILPKKLTAQLKEFVKQGQIPQLMFTGTAGIGKHNYECSTSHARRRQAHGTN